MPPELTSPLAAFGVSLIAVLWAAEGYYFLTYAAGEIRDPARTLPRALTIGLLAIAVIYLAANLAYLYALPMDRAARHRAGRRARRDRARRAVGRDDGRADGGRVDPRGERGGDPWRVTRDVRDGLAWAVLCRGGAGFIRAFAVRTSRCCS